MATIETQGATVQSPDGTKAPATSSGERDGRKMDRSLFLKGIDTGADFEGRSAQSVETVRGKDFDPSTGLRARYENFLHGYVTNLDKLRREPGVTAGKTKLDELFEDTGQAYKKAIWDELVVEKYDATGKVIGIDRDKIDDKISQYLRDNESNWMNTTMLMEDQTFTAMAALREVAMFLPEDERMKLDRTFFTGDNKGVFDALRMRLSQINLPRLRGDRVQMVKSSNASDVLATMPREAIYALENIGIDITALRGGRLTSSAQLLRGRDPREIRKQMMQGFDARKMLLTELGMSSQGVDFLPEQWLYKSGLPGSKPERSDAQWVHDVYNIYIEKLNSTPTANETQRRKLFIEARREMIVRNAEQSAKEEAEKKRVHRVEDMLKKKKEEYSGSDGKSKVQADIEKKISDLEAQKTKAKGEKDEPFKEYNAAKEEHKKLEEEFSTEIKHTVPITGNLKTDIDAELTATINKLNGVGTTKSLDEQIKKLETEKNKRANDLTAANKTSRGLNTAPTTKDKNVVAAYDANVNRAVADAASVAEAEFGFRIKKLNEEIKELEKKRDDLNALQQRLRKTEKASVNAERDLIASLPKHLEAELEALSKLSPPPPAVGISGADLEAKSVQELLDIAKPLLPGKTEDEVRQSILYAKTARAAEARYVYDKGNPTNEAKFNELTDPLKAHRITPDELLTQSKENLLYRLTTSFGVSATDANDVLEKAQTEARRRTKIQFELYKDEEVKDLDAQIKVQNEKKAAADPKERLDKIEATEGLRARQGEIFRGKNIARIIKEVNKFTDKTPAPQTNTDPNYTDFSPAERDAKYSAGYYEFMDYMFDYRRDSNKNRDEYFKQIITILPPEKLAELLKDELAILPPPIISTIPFSLDYVFDQIKSGINPTPPMAIKYYEEDLRKAFGSIIDKVSEDTIRFITS